jgi:hypothetical protein
MRRLFIRLALFLPVVVLMATVNYVVDPAGLFQVGGEREVARLLQAGSNVVVSWNALDDRQIQRHYVEGLTGAPAWILVGSSRGLFTRHQAVASESFFNHGVSGATIEDFVAIVGLYSERGLLPKHIILTIDPWILNRSNGQWRWQSLRGAYYPMARSLGISLDHGLKAFYVDATVRRMAELLSPSYFQTSLRALLYAPPGAPHLLPTDRDEPGDFATILRDGSLVYPRNEHNRAPDDVARTVREGLYKGYSLGSFHRLDPDLLDALNRTITFVMDRGVELTLVLIPYHPLEYQRMMRSLEHRIVSDVESTIHDVAQEHAVVVLGSYDPAKAGCAAEEFYDAIHPRPTCTQRLLEPLRRPRTRAAAKAMRPKTKPLRPALQ